MKTNIRLSAPAGYQSFMILYINHAELISLTYLFSGLRFIKVSISYVFNVMFTAMV